MTDDGIHVIAQYCHRKTPPADELIKRSDNGAVMTCVSGPVDLLLYDYEYPSVMEIDASVNARNSLYITHLDIFEAIRSNGKSLPQPEKLPPDNAHCALNMSLAPSTLCAAMQKTLTNSHSARICLTTTQWKPYRPQQNDSRYTQFRNRNLSQVFSCMPMYQAPNKKSAIDGFYRNQMQTECINNVF
jgi:hypothetical protein